jgi:membrane fusion protein, multidrug efflux system
MKTQANNYYKEFFLFLVKSVIFIVLIAFLLAGCTSSTATTPTAAAAPATLPVLKIEATTATTETEFPASIHGTTDVEIRPQVSGTLDKIFIDEGAYVKQGQPLFKINDRPYVEQLNNAIASQAAAEAAVVNAQLEVEKLTPLVQNKVVSDYQLKTAKASLSIAKANAAQARANVAAAKINVGYTLIKAPVNGYIGRLPKKQGSQLSPADPEALTQLSDIKEVYAYFSLGENDFINFKSEYAGATLGDKIKNLPPVTLVLADNSVYGEKGKIDMVDGQFDKTTGAITLRATFPNANGLLRSGNTGKIRLSVAHDNSVVVPQDATMEIQDKVFVFVVDQKNTVTRTPVTITGTSGTDYMISDGLKPGDRIVVKGFESLPDGTVINPQTAQKAIANR